LKVSFYSKQELSSYNNFFKPEGTSINTMNEILKISFLILLPIFGFSKINNEPLKLEIDSTDKEYQLGVVFGLGGESKLALFLPKINFIRMHNLKKVAPYYGLELGIHGNLVSASGSISGIIGIEKSIFRLESSLSHFRTSKIRIDENEINGPFSQNLINIKLGIKVKNVVLKIGRSFLLNEYIPNGQKRIPLLDIGKINNKIYGIELQIILK